MQFWRHAHDEFAGERFVRLFIAGSTERQVIFDRVFKGLFQVLNGFALKRDEISGVDHLAVEYASIFVDFDNGLKTFVVHGWSPSGLIPTSARKRLIEATAPRSVSFCGCGR